MKRVSGWNWCSRCGYREEGEEPAQVLTRDQTRAPKSGASTSELSLALRTMPSWGWFLIFGLCLVAGISAIADYNLPDKSLVRAVWSTVQVLGGLAVFLAAGVAVSCRFRAMHQPLGLLDFLLPDRLWVLAAKHLPATRWHICTAAWTMMAILCGVIWVGGLTYWLPTKSKPQAGHVFAKRTVKAAPVKDEEPEDEPNKAEETPVEKPATANPEEPAEAEPEDDDPAKKTVTKCVIVGYTSKDGELTGLLMSTVHGKELHYAGIVPAPKDPELRKDLLRRSDSLKTGTPIFPDLGVDATWLKPRLSCEVESHGVDENQILKKSAFKGLIFPKKPKPAPLPAGDRKDEKDGKDASKTGNSKSTPDKKKPAVRDQARRRLDSGQITRADGLHAYRQAPKRGRSDAAQLLS
jgi:hypothetical protein